MSEAIKSPKPELKSPVQAAMDEVQSCAGIIANALIVRCAQHASRNAELEANNAGLREALTEALGEVENLKKSSQTSEQQ